jgi:O-acetyl-ADP-ribose deacetylase (regulator of RNase III)
MIVYRPDQSLFDSNAQVITNTVNCVGVMGKGIAAEFKARYPEMYADYRARCARGEVKPGQPYIWDGQDQMILNFPTKDHWRGDSRMEWIDAGLQWIRDNHEDLGISTIALPPVGCGNGGLLWTDVRELVEKHFADLEYLLVSVYLPRVPASSARSRPGKSKSLAAASE